MFARSRGEKATSDLQQQHNFLNSSLINYFNKGNEKQLSFSRSAITSSCELRKRRDSFGFSFFFFFFLEKRKENAAEEQKASLRIVNTDLLAFSLDWRTGPVFIVCFNASTDSRPGCSAHFSLTDLGILPSVWFGQRNKQEMGCNCTKTALSPLLFLRIKLESRKKDAKLTFKAHFVYFIHVHVACHTRKYIAIAVRKKGT